MTLLFSPGSGQETSSRAILPPTKPSLKKLPSFISLPLLQAVGGVIDASDGLRIFTAVRGVFVIFLAEHTVFHDIFGGFVSAKSYFFPVLCYLTGDG